MEGRNCKTCGKPIPAPARGCPACLLGSAVTAEARFAGDFTVPDPESLEAEIAGVEVLELIARGGMGAVFLARQVELDRMVALKVLPLEAKDHPEFEERFRLEARTLAKLDHPHIVSVYDFGKTASGLFYILMEYVEQGPTVDVVAEMMQVCDALDYAHSQGVIHRDIKPGNVLIDKAGQVKIADFGLAALTEAAPDTGLSVTLTEANAVLGTLRYMAPECQKPNASIDGRADIYSAGVMLYEGLTGEYPLGAFDPPSKLNSSVDRHLDSVALCALQNQPSKRYQNAGEMRMALQGSRRRSAGKARWLIGLGVSIAIVVIAIKAFPLGRDLPVVPDFGRSVFRDDFDDGEVDTNGGEGWFPIFSHLSKKTLAESGGVLTFQSNGDFWESAILRSLETHSWPSKGQALTFVWEIEQIDSSTEDPTNTDYSLQFGLRPETDRDRQSADPNEFARIASDHVGLEAVIYFNRGTASHPSMYFKDGSGLNEHARGKKGITVGNLSEIWEAGSHSSKLWLTVDHEGLEYGWSLSPTRVRRTWESLGLKSDPGVVFERGIWSYHSGKNVHEGRGGHRLGAYEVFVTKGS